MEIKKTKRKSKLVIIGLLLFVIIAIALIVLQNIYSSQANNTKIEDARQNLLNHLDIQEKRGYILEDEIINNILPSISSYSLDKNVEVVYEYNQQSISVNTNNEDWKEQIKEKLDGNYFKIKYEYGENYKIEKITIQKIGNETETESEKNENIKFEEGTQLDTSIIENVKSENYDEESNNFVFENNVNAGEKSTENIDKFKMCLVYDSETNNYVLAKSDNKNYDKIDSYKVYSSGVDIILKKGVKLEKSYYTLRINRYDSNFSIIKTSDYYYLFEPVVTTATTSENRTVLEIKFGQQTYSLNQLKNIEIIFGSME